MLDRLVAAGVTFAVVNVHYLGDMVAARHLPAPLMRQWRRTTAGGRLLLGFAGTGLLLIPFVNFVAPVLGAAMATHWFHERRGK